MIRRLIYFVLMIGITAGTCSCALLQKTIDKHTGFTNHLKQTENYIRSEEWENAKESLADSEKTWKKVKPLLQVDIDHDYVNSIEEDFVKLGGYMDAREKADSLATILLVQDTWDNIGSL